MSFSSSVVTLNCFGLDDAGRVAFLPVLALRCDGAGHVARTQSESSSECRQCRDKHRDNDFDDLLLAHS